MRPAAASRELAVALPVGEAYMLQVATTSWSLQ
jgi:hypothetical protein